MIKLIHDVVEDMNKQLERIETSLNRLNEDQIWTRLQPGMNSVGNYCLHLAGNEYQNLVTGIGNQPLIRERSAEFNTNGGLSREELLAKLHQVRTESTAILSSLVEEDLSREVTIPYELTDWNRMNRREDEAKDAHEHKFVRSLLIKVSSHYGYHTGQIVLLSKLLQPSDEHLTGLYH
ncbi:DUF1572 family protein [Paenibacillus taichungensis]|uniref:DUF1572 family protein n=1 Tax=Paenibacillus taichungensis TaxID=484184 RepID=UPI002DBE6B88|nr:DUF1572 family protein [Paenibacillus taichungensis]MEC0105960.1 DUF1572 family protein [Paenibacillus taichungensis]MEC0196649.1 DUF1572 family protein [Paenibacillus taichungensis]